MSNKPHISVVIPVYNCVACLDELYRRLVVTLEKINKNFEIIMVNDASPQEDWAIIQELAAKDDRVKGIDFTRNFGQHHAIIAGLDFANAEWIVVMDGDLQDPPEEIIVLYTKANEGYDVVFGRRELRQDTYFKKITSKIFRKIFDYLTGEKTDSAVANFSICSIEVIKKFRCFKECERTYPDFIRWMGYNIAYINIKHAERLNGKSSYNFRKKVDLATQIIVTHSNKPLQISLWLGLITTLLSLSYAAWLIIRFIFFANPPNGWTSTIVSIYLIGGLLFANIGMLGLYIGKIFNEVKSRPFYIIKNKVNL